MVIASSGIATLLPRSTIRPLSNNIIPLLIVGFVTGWMTALTRAIGCFWAGAGIGSEHQTLILNRNSVIKIVDVNFIIISSRFWDQTASRSSYV
jgi:ABC-type molybdate transport system permease subunit